MLSLYAKKVRRIVFMLSATVVWFWSNHGWDVQMTPAHDPKPGEYGPLAHQGKYATIQVFLHSFGPWKTWPEMAPEARIFSLLIRPYQGFVRPGF